MITKLKPLTSMAIKAILTLITILTFGMAFKFLDSAPQALNSAFSAPALPSCASTPAPPAMPGGGSDSGMLSASGGGGSLSISSSSTNGIKVCGVFPPQP